MGLDIRVLPQRLAICRLDPGSALPGWATAGTFRAVTWTPGELSIVCEGSDVPADVAAERDWRAFMVQGPLDFGLTGILLQLAEPLAMAEISIFAISTFDTDYVLVKEAFVDTAVRVLADAGHTVR
jgi:hypothetical protein